MVLMPLLSRLLTLLVILTMPLFLARLTLIPIKSLSICFRRSEERRVGKECRCRGSPYHEKKKGERKSRIRRRHIRNRAETRGRELAGYTTEHKRSCTHE